MLVTKMSFRLHKENIRYKMSFTLFWKNTELLELPKSHQFAAFSAHSFWRMESRKEIEKDEQILNLLSNPFMRLYLYVQKGLVEDANTGLHTTHNQSKQL